MPKPRTDNVLADLSPDGLECPKISAHTRSKLFALGYYLQECTKAIERLFAHRIYIDLFAGAGRNQFPTGSQIEGSPLIALRTRPEFTKLIFVEDDETNLSALRERIKRDFPYRDVTLHFGNCNDLADVVASAVPDKSLTVCFVDPRDLTIKFSTLRRLAKLRIDFVVLIADRMAGSRDPTLKESDSTVIADFLDDADWRARWEAAKVAGASFHDFITDRFDAAMRSLAFEPGSRLRVRIDGKGVGLYWLVLYSRDPLALKLWDWACKKAPAQESLF